MTIKQFLLDELTALQANVNAWKSTGEPRSLVMLATIDGMIKEVHSWPTINRTVESVPLDSIEGRALVLDATRWRLLPRFIEEFQIDYVELVSRIDAEPKS